MKKIALPLFFACALLLSNIADSHMVTVNSVEEYYQHYNGNTPMITLYAAEWCPPCKQIKPHFYAAAKAADDITFCVIDIDASAFAPILSQISGVPTIIYSHKGKPVTRTVGGKNRQSLDTAIQSFRNMVR